MLKKDDNNSNSNNSVGDNSQYVKVGEGELYRNIGEGVPFERLRRITRLPCRNNRQMEQW
jgi:hypothetical protein